MSHAPGSLRYFGNSLHQHPDKAVTVYGDEKLEGIKGETVTLLRRHEMDSPINAIEHRSFSSANASIGWLGITVSPRCAEFSSRRQKLAPLSTFKD